MHSPRVHGLLFVAAWGIAACSSEGTAPPRPDISSTGPTPAEIRSIEIPTGDLVFDAKVAGPEDGEAVFLLHGFPETSYEWRYALPELGKAGYRAIAPDQRGYSPRARPTEVSEYAVTTLVDDVIRMADALGIERFHVVGHDWGAAVAWAVPAIAQERVISLTAASVPHPDAFAQVLADPESCQYAASSYFDFFVTPAATDFFVNDGAAGLKSILAGLPEDDIAVYVEALGTPDAIDGALAWYRANIENRTFKDAFRVGPTQVPTLFVWSSGDVAICSAGAEITRDFVDGDYRYEVVPDVAHWVVELANERFNAALLAHLAAFSDAAP
jgi:pimeloyl-ACP methyl ester carboxylesterase